MKDYTYYDSNKINLQMVDTRWLIDMGLKETRWILDVIWLINRNRIFSEWIKNK